MNHDIYYFMIFMWIQSNNNMVSQKEHCLFHKPYLPRTIRLHHALFYFGLICFILDLALFLMLHLHQSLQLWYSVLWKSSSCIRQGSNLLNLTSILLLFLSERDRLYRKSHFFDSSISPHWLLVLNHSFSCLLFLILNHYRLELWLFQERFQKLHSIADPLFF